MTSSLLVIRRRRPIGEPATRRPRGASGAATLEGTAGAGRIVHALTEAGIDCDAAHQLVIPPDAAPDDLRGLDVGERFGSVVLGSHLVNLPEPSHREAFVDLAARHVAAGGALLVEHHPVDWAATAADEEPTPGAALGMVEVRRHPPFVSAVSVFDIGGRVERQAFTARVLSEAELAEAIATAGFAIARRISPTLIEARRGA